MGDQQIMIKAVLFDMDGVLLDSECAHLNIEKELFEKLGLNITYEEHRSLTGTTTKDMFTFLKGKYGLPQTVDELIEMKDGTYYKHLEKEGNIPLIPGSSELARTLHEDDFKLAVASSAPLAEIKLVLDMHRLRSIFHEYASGQEVPKGKPAPDVFLLAASRLKVNPDECVVIEDSSNGVLAAKIAGMKCIGLKSENSGKQDLSRADMIVSSLRDLTPAIIKALG